ncbi:hypothetical protein [Pseudomonas putida]|uniref:hypothetical protein n=1 Tax=Pseudomonas putida TaxID=303 RepID=UPI000B1D44A2|nr:hypothetical protein [Pseudomonas putida]
MNNKDLKFEDIIKVKTLFIALLAYITAKLLSNALIVSAHFYGLVDFIRFNEVHVNRIVVILLLCIARDIFKAAIEKRGIVFSFPTYLAIAVTSLLANTNENVDHLSYSLDGIMVYLIITMLILIAYGIQYSKLEKLLLPILVFTLIIIPATKNLHDELSNNLETKELNIKQLGVYNDNENN